jgi:hypothetical protein
MDYKEQLRLWVEGNSVHVGGKQDGRCCPDFSCCNPENKAPKEERELFQDLYLAERHDEYERLLMMFLGRALNGHNVYIAGGKP